MVASNPLFHGKWTLRRLQSTVLSNVWPEVIVFSTFAAVIVLVHERGVASMATENQLLTVGGIVLGLVISFRTTSSYERFQEGSELWASIGTASLCLARLIWLYVPNERSLPDEEPSTPLNVIIEKKTMINLIHGFVVSVKHLLRDEPGVFYEDLYPSVAFLPKFPTPVRHNKNDLLPIWQLPGGHRLTDAALRRRDTIFDMTEVDKHPPLKPSSLPPDTSIYDYLPLLKVPRWGMRKAMEAVDSLQGSPESPETLRPKKKRSAYADIVESTVPLEIALVLSSYTEFLMRHDLVDGPIVGEMTENIIILQDTVSQLQRICCTPLAFAYQAHLRMSVWLYILFLPFQLVDGFGYYTILATAAITFLICGFLELGKQIENPFNYDLNDLDLDHYCDSIRSNLLEVTAQSDIEPSSYIFTSRNQPLAPCDRRTADKIVPTSQRPSGFEGKPSASRSQTDSTLVNPDPESSVQRTLLRNWAEVSRLTTRRTL